MTIVLNGWEVQDTRPPFTDAEFFDFCAQNPNLHIEQDALGNIIIMPPVSLNSGMFESEMQIELGTWNRKTRKGKTFSPSTLFILPNGEKRMPDAAWIALEKINALPEAEREHFAHIVPDFVAEIRSPSDSLTGLQTKMRDSWIANGVRLAWLIDPEAGCAWVYRADGSTDMVEGFDQVLSGEDVLEGFELPLRLFEA
ncbi:MAG: Uma2 family endonuclease [Saprospiraceae bacterium]|nr:Uma2 family endonuclease [Saprospiraceae bacterium]